MVMQPIQFNPSWFACYTRVYKDKMEGKKSQNILTAKIRKKTKCKCTKLYLSQRILQRSKGARKCPCGEIKKCYCT